MRNVSVWGRPFQRWLSCTCGCDQLPRPIEDVVNDQDAKFEVTKHFRFAFTCPQSGVHGDAQVVDVLTEPDNPDKIRLSHIKPEDLYPVEDQFADENRVIWRIPAEYIASVVSGKLPYVAEVERGVLQALSQPAPAILLSKEAVREEPPK